MPPTSPATSARRHAGGSGAAPGGTEPGEAHLDELCRLVVAWGGDHRRDLPWRQTREPWAILVSELMLQQTQVARVLDPYRRFLDRFPTPAACAATSPGEVVRSWAGLGYNRRAVFLHRAATAMVERHGGAVPGTLAELRQLPGVGPYTARAVLAFGFGQRCGVVDTNVARLLARAVAGRPLGPSEAQALADRLVGSADPWALNQALFDLGSRHCTGRRPDCSTCPLAVRCAWSRRGRPGPDPASGSAGTSRPQSPFAGSDRQGRGRLVAALRQGDVLRSDLAATAGWVEDPGRAERAADRLVEDGLARWIGDRLTLC